MISTISPLVSTLILMTTVLATGITWLGFYHISRQTLSTFAHRIASGVVGLLLFGGLFQVMYLGMQNFYNTVLGTPLLPPLPNIAFGMSNLVIAYIVLMVVPSFRKVVDAIPQHWLIGIQTFRVLGGVFLILYVQGTLPGEFALPAGTGDLLTGLAAPIVAYLYFARKAGHRWIALGWNLFGLADLILALILGVLTTPGATQQLAVGFPYTDYGLTSAFPLILIPGYRVPQGILFHILSLRALARVGAASKQEQIPRVTPASSPAVG